MPYKDLDVAREYRIRIREQNKTYIKEYLQNHPCNCGYSDIRALDFDHMDPKEKTRSISKMSNGTPSLESLKKEIDKCQVLCANCHRIKTIENQDWKNETNKTKK